LTATALATLPSGAFTPFTAFFLAALLASVGVRCWLSRRQERHVLAHRDQVPAPFLPTIPLDVHRKAADYAVARTRFSRVAAAWDALVLLALTVGGGLEALARLLPAGGLAAGTAYVVAAFLVHALLLLPLDVWSTFAIEQRFGFNRTTPALFVADLAKGALVGTAIGAPLAAGALWLTGRGALWWLWAWGGYLAVSLALAWAYPVLIAPLFHRFRPLADEALARRIEGLLARTGFSSRGVFVMDGSRRSTHANAYFTGLGRRRRIVFFDTLLGLLGPEEIEAVLAHELGHYKLRHQRKRLVAGAALSLAGFAVLARLVGAPWFYEGLGAGTPAPRVGLVLFALVAPVFLFLLRPLLTAISRRHEYEADAFAAAQGGAPAMASALLKLSGHNASTLTPDPLHSAFHDTHPPVPLRIARLR
jgi:STE24 endopeptidase